MKGKKESNKKGNRKKKENRMLRNNSLKRKVNIYTKIIIWFFFLISYQSDKAIITLKHCHADMFDLSNIKWKIK